MLRALLLVLMTTTHPPTRLHVYSHDLFVSAAEGFVWVLCGMCLALRYAEHCGFTIDAPWLFDKWRLAPVRLLNFAGMTLLLCQVGPACVRSIGHRMLARFGRASRTVFVGHIIVCMLAYSIVDDANAGLEP